MDKIAAYELILSEHPLWAKEAAGLTSFRQGLNSIVGKARDFGRRATVAPKKPSRLTAADFVGDPEFPTNPSEQKAFLDYMNMRNNIYNNLQR